MGDGPFINSFGALTHEIREQYFYQYKYFRTDLMDDQPKRLAAAHMKAVNMEGRINGFIPTTDSNFLDTINNVITSIVIPFNTYSVNDTAHHAIKFYIYLDSINNVSRKKYHSTLYSK